MATIDNIRTDLQIPDGEATSIPEVIEFEGSEFEESMAEEGIFFAEGINPEDAAKAVWRWLRRKITGE